MRRIGTCVGLVAATWFLLTIHQTANPTFLASFRVGLLVLVVLLWRRAVDLLVSGGVVHPLRRTSAIAFRWRFLVLIVMIEVLVIQQIPALLEDAIGD